MLTHTLRSAADLEQVAEASYVPVLTTPRADFRGHFVAHSLGDAVTLTEARTTPLRTVQTARMAARCDRDDLLFFCIHLAGDGRLRQDGRVASLGPGSGALYEARSAWELDVATDVHSLLLQFPRSALGRRSTEITAGLARGMNPAAATTRLLVGYIEQLAGLAGDLSASQRHDAGLVGIDMLRMALRGESAGTPSDRSADAVLLGMMRRHIRERLADPELTVASLARRHHVSVRRTHVLFGRMGATPGAYIREQRLLAAEAMLSDPRFAHRSIAEIAAEAGIFQLRTFERAFVRRYGATPAQWRRDSLRGSG